MTILGSNSKLRQYEFFLVSFITPKALDLMALSLQNSTKQYYGENMKNYLFVGFYFLLLGCGGSENGPNVVHHTSAQDLLKMQSENIAVSCQDGDCPANVGFLVIKKDLDKAVCTFSLVSETTVLTNKHCLPEKLKYENALCGDDIIAVFINQHGEKEFVGCDIVESVSSKNLSGDDYFQTDYAFLKLSKRINRTPLVIDTILGVQDKEVLTSYVATPVVDRGNVSIKIEKKNCIVHMNSQVHAPFNSPYKSVIVLKGCPITHGNSGSALVGNDGKVKGVLQISFDKNLSFPGDQIASMLDDFAVGTNATCFENKYLNITPYHQTCDMNEDRSGIRISADHIKDQARSDVKEIMVNLSSNSNKFIFAPYTKENQIQETTTIEFLPYCFKGKQGNLPWLEQYRRSGLSSFLSNFPEIVKEDIQTVTYNFTVGIDEDARPRGTFVSEETKLSLRIPVKHIANNLDSPEFSIEISGDSGPRRTLKLPVCNE